MELGKLEVGQKFPAEYHKHDSLAIFLDGPAFNLIISAGGVTAMEAKVIRKGRLRVGAAAVQNIPVVVIDCPGYGTLDAMLNLLAEPQVVRDAFLAGEPAASLVTLCLVDNQTDIIKSIRVLNVEADLMQAIKAAAFAQVVSYGSFSEVYAVIKQIEAEHTTEQLIGLAKMQVFI